MAGNSQEYISHHLTNLTYGKLPAGYVRHNEDGSETELTEATWTMAHTKQEAADMGFSAIHVDSMGWSFGLGALIMFLFWRAAKKASTAVPTGF